MCRLSHKTHNTRVRLLASFSRFPPALSLFLVVHTLHVLYESLCLLVNHRPDPSDALGDTSDEENTPPQPKSPPSGKRKTLKQQVIEKDGIIAQLEGVIAGLQSDILELRRTHRDSLRSISHANETLSARNQLLYATNQSLATRKRKAETALSEEITRKHKRIKRLERDRESKAEAADVSLGGMKDQLSTAFKEIERLDRDLAQATSHIRSRDALISSLQLSLREKQSTLTTTRNRFYAAQKQTQRAKTLLKEIRGKYKQLLTWDPTEHGQYRAVSRN
ncbi:hypothetical protein B0H13DRAFT_2309848 [Mycena leptocephala]|nr:hypothetical protein B0H13DRAFT_2309848 [Mycena leptocephala]